MKEFELALKIGKELTGEILQEAAGKALGVPPAKVGHIGCYRDPETALPESDRNIMACAMPGLPPELHIVYGNKWIARRLSPLLQRSLPLFLIQTDYVPAFLANPFEVCLYLFLMDYCIIKEDYQKVKDEDLKGFLHIFRPSPMLKIKGLL